MGMIDSFIKLFNKGKDIDNTNEEIITNNIVYEIDEADRIVVALATSAMAAQDKPNSEFHISKITRIK